jgi:hypothetical protein
MERKKVEHIASYSPRTRSLYAALKQYADLGCRISLQGRDMDPVDIADQCFQENVSYMMDFDGDESGRICRVNLEMIRDGSVGSRRRDARKEGRERMDPGGSSEQSLKVMQYSDWNY